MDVNLNAKSQTKCFNHFRFSLLSLEYIFAFIIYDDLHYLSLHLNCIFDYITIFQLLILLQGCVTHLHHNISSHHLAHWFLGLQKGK